MLQIDSSAGGQIFRTSIGIAALTGKAVKISNIRADRPQPGLKAQHLTALETVARLCNASLEGAKLASKEISFSPKETIGGNFAVNIGTAGSITLLLQSAQFPALLRETKLHIIGGTNVAWSPPIEFLQHSLLPVLNFMGGKFTLKINNYGYYPKGQGSVGFSSKPAKLPLKPIQITELGSLEFIKIFSHCASLPKAVALNQCKAAKNSLQQLNVDFEEIVECKEQAATIGSSITLFAYFSTGAVISANSLGAKGKPAEQVGKEAAQRLLQELNPKKPVDSHLADQLVPYMALAKGNSAIGCTALTEHCLNNIAVCEQLLGVKFTVKGEKEKPATLSVQGAAFKS